jgi:GTP pyrophosphokinase
MSATHTEKQANDSDTDDIVAEVRRYLAALPKKDGLEIAINEGEQVAAIIKPLGLPAKIVAAVYAYPLFRENILKSNDLQNNELNDVSRFIIGLQQLNQFSLPAKWQPGESLAVQQSESLRKMLLAVVSDVRLVLVRIAEQLFRLREAREAPRNVQQALAIETREIYAALANRLGVWQLK